MSKTISERAAAAVTPAAASWLSAVVTDLLPGSWALRGCCEGLIKQLAGWEERLEPVVILVMCLEGVWHLIPPPQIIFDTRYFLTVSIKLLYGFNFLSTFTNASACP